MMKAAITGEMGSGKSWCCAVLARFGVPVFNTDMCAKRLMDENDEVKYMLKKMISRSLYDDEGRIDRAELQYRLFEFDDAARNREALNMALYTYVRVEYKEFLEKHKDARYTLIESAILFETGWFEEVDYIIYVDCPREERVRRVIERSQLSVEQQNARTRYMLNPKLKMRASDLIIQNPGSDSIDDMEHQLYNTNKFLIDESLEFDESNKSNDVYFEDEFDDDSDDGIPF